MLNAYMLYFCPVFEKLKKKWKVDSWQLFMILCVFAITGTTTAFISKSITSWVGLTPDSPLAYRALLRGSVLIFGYQVIILIVAFFFGQFKFFWAYEKKVWSWFTKTRRIKAPASNTSLEGKPSVQ